MRLLMLTLSIIYIECDCHIESSGSHEEICNRNDQHVVKICGKPDNACNCVQTWTVRCDDKDIWIGSHTLDNGCQTLSGATADTSIENLIQMGTASADNDDDMNCVRRKLDRCTAYVCARKTGGWNPESWHIYTDGDTCRGKSKKRIWISDDYCNAASPGCIWIHKRHCTQPAPTPSGETTAQTPFGVTCAQTTSGGTSAQTTSGVTSAPTSSGVTTAQTPSGVTSAQTTSGVTSAQTTSGVTSAKTTSGGTPVQTTSTERSDTTTSSSNGQTTDVQIVENICPDCEQKSGICVWVPSDGPPVEEVNKLIKSLLLEKKTLSSYKHTKTSAQDDRPSAKAIGQTGVVLCVLGFVGVVLLDAGRLVNWLEMRRRRRLSLRP